jgi:diaminopimelate epimerase
MTGETLAFTKGHGTENDFVLLFDEAGSLELSPALVRALCDRRAGIGADGVLRAVRAGLIPDGAEFPPDSWFMDYRNADGTTAEMCGNGARVFAAFLEREAGEDFGEGVEVATRAGVRVVTALGGGRYSVGMGRWTIPGQGKADATVSIAGIEDRPGVTVNVGNPHTVVAVEYPRELEAADLSVAPRVTPIPPEGTNVELVASDASVEGGRGSLRMRVHERGVGETRSCGTGACAAVVAARAWEGPGAPAEWDVGVPGGQLAVRIVGDEAILEGSAVLVADGLLSLSSLTRA